VNTFKRNDRVQHIHDTIEVGTVRGTRNDREYGKLIKVTWDGDTKGEYQPDLLEPADTCTAMTHYNEDDFIHTISRFEWLIGDVLRLRTPRTLCGASLDGDPNEPGPAAPLCPKCNAANV